MLIPLAVLLAIAVGLIVAGVALISTAAAFITAGVLLAVWSCLFLLDVGPGDGEAP